MVMGRMELVHVSLEISCPCHAVGTLYKCRAALIERLGFRIVVVRADEINHIEETVTLDHVGKGALPHIGVTPFRPILVAIDGAFRSIHSFFKPRSPVGRALAVEIHVR